MSKQRLQFIDALRGLAIFLVVLGHSFFFNGLLPAEGNTECSLPAFWVNIIYYVHLPLFFFISGYFLSDTPQNLKNTCLQIWKKVRQLFIPFLVCTFLLSLWKGYPYWFLKTLFCFFLLCYPLNYLRSKFNCNIIVTILYFVLASVFGYYATKAPILRSFFDFKLEFFVFFLLGYLNKKTNYTRFVTDFPAAVFIIITCAWIYIDNANIYHSLVLNYVVGFLLIGVLWRVFSKMENARVLNIFSMLGNNTIEIYIIHFYFGLQIPELTNYMIEHVMSTDKSIMVTTLCLELITYTLITICMITATLITAKILKSNKYISLLLFGRE